MLALFKKFQLKIPYVSCLSADEKSLGTLIFSSFYLMIQTSFLDALMYTYIYLYTHCV